jgi:hypothetical protein
MSQIATVVELGGSTIAVVSLVIEIQGDETSAYRRDTSSVI